MLSSLNATLVADLQDEMTRAVLVHGDLPYTGDRCLTIMIEEVGEVAEALLDWARADIRDRPLHLRHLQEELIQVMAVAARWINNMEEGLMI